MANWGGGKKIHPRLKERKPSFTTGRKCVTTKEKKKKNEKKRDGGNSTERGNRPCLLD